MNYNSQPLTVVLLQLARVARDEWQPIDVHFGFKSEELKEDEENSKELQWCLFSLLVDWKKKENTQYLRLLSQLLKRQMLEVGKKSAKFVKKISEFRGLRLLVQNDVSV